jgi:hypothetical protein
MELPSPSQFIITFGIVTPDILSYLSGVTYTEMFIQVKELDEPDWNKSVKFSYGAYQDLQRYMEYLLNLWVEHKTLNKKET